MIQFRVSFDANVNFKDDSNKNKLNLRFDENTFQKAKIKFNK